MTKRKATDAKGTTLIVEAHAGESPETSISRAMVSPYLRHGCLAHTVTMKMFGKLPDEPQFDDYSRAIKAQADAVAKGDLSSASEMLMSQAVSLDMLFAELARRATNNMGDYPQATERYARLAFKAQSGSRATLEALAKLHQPREQTVRHVHVNEGGQAIVADQFHQHGGGTENAKSDKQSHATGAAGGSASLPSPDPLGNGVPISGSEGQAAMQDARRDKSGSA